MKFKEEVINFKEDTIKFVDPISVKFKDAVGASLNTLENVSQNIDNVSNQDFVLGQDLIEKQLNAAIGVVSNDALKKRNEAKDNKKQYKKSKRSEKQLDKEIKVARQENVQVHAAFDERFAYHNDLKGKFKNTDWTDKQKEKQVAKFKIDEAKALEKEAYANIQASNAKLDNLGEQREKARSNKDNSKNQRKENKKEASKDDKKVAALKTILAAKQGINNTNESPDDLMQAGRQGILGGVLDAINPIEYLKQRMLQYLMGLISTVITTIISFITPILAMILVIVVVLSAVYGVFSSIVNFVSGSSDGVVYNSLLTDDEINELILERGWEWEYDYDQDGNRIDSSARKVSTLPQEQQDLLYFAFSKIGYPYSQEYRDSGSYYDCSSLAYYTEMSIGKNISDGTAAGQANRLYNAGKAISSSAQMEIGDLIYYGGHDNGRYLGIYHVAIYVGNGYSVEAFSTGQGVIYTPCRSKNVVMICRP